MTVKRSVHVSKARPKAKFNSYSLKLNRRSDADIIALLDGQRNVQGYIKSLIRADIAARSAGKEQV